MEREMKFMIVNSFLGNSEMDWLMPWSRPRWTQMFTSSSRYKLWVRTVLKVWLTSRLWWSIRMGPLIIIHGDSLCDRWVNQRLCPQARLRQKSLRFTSGCKNLSWQRLKCWTQCFKKRHLSYVIYSGAQWLVTVRLTCSLLFFSSRCWPRRAIR